MALNDDETMREIRRRGIVAVQIIYSADVLGSEREITRMSPERHLVAGYTTEPSDNQHGGMIPRPDMSARLGSAIAARFTQTEDDSEWEFGYLGKERGYGMSGLDKEIEQRRWMSAADKPDGLCLLCWKELNLEQGADNGTDAWVYIHQYESDHDPEPVDDDAFEQMYEGYHRKWVGMLSRYEWEHFASRYYIDLDDDGIPESYENTLGALTGEGLLYAVSVDMSEGWQDYSGPSFVYANAYISFASKREEGDE